MDLALKLRHTVDALFGRGASSRLPRGIDFELSPRTGRARAAYHGGRLLCTLRTDGGLAVTPHMAGLLLGSREFRERCLEVDAESAPFVRQGRSVFCRHVVWCGRHVRAAADVPVLFGGEVIAVGTAALPAAMIASAQRGVAVRVRDSLKGRGAGAGP